MMNVRKLIVPLFLLAAAPLAFGQTKGVDPTSVLDFLKLSMAPALNKLTAQAISWLGVFATLQFFITNYNLLKTDGDIQSAIAKMFGTVAWVGICIYVINNGPGFISAVGDQMFNLLGFEFPTPGSIISMTVGISATLGALAVGVGGFPLFGGTAGMILTYVMFGILLVGMYFAFKIFMLQLELGLIAMLSPLSFSFLGLNTLKDQGIAPFKALISLTYRILLLAVILSAFKNVSEVFKTAITSIDKDSSVGGFGTTIEIIVSAIGAYLLLAYLTFKSDAIAATLASGSTSMGTGDVAQAAAAGAALGAAVAAGGSATATSAAKIPKSMSDFMSKLTGGGSGSISNASPMGSGGDAPTFTPPEPAAMSVAGSAAVSGGPSAAKPPTRPLTTTGAAAATPVTSGRYGQDLSDAAGSQISSQSPVGAPYAGADSAKPASNGATAMDAPIADPATTSAMPSGDPMAPPTVQSTSTSPASGTEDLPSIGGARRAGRAEAGSQRLEETLDTLAKHFGQPPRKPTLGERLGDANRQLAQEQTAVHVSINPHHD